MQSLAELMRVIARADAATPAQRERAEFLAGAFDLERLLRGLHL